MIELIVWTILVVANAVAAISVSALVGKATHSRSKDMPYESGIVPTGNARLRMAIPYYLVAIFFLMFDVELAFLYAWAVRFYALGWNGMIKAMIFIAFLTAGLIYIWLRGGLVWRHHSKKASNKATSSLN